MPHYNLIKHIHHSRHTVTLAMLSFFSPSSFVFTPQRPPWAPGEDRCMSFISWPPIPMSYLQLSVFTHLYVPCRHILCYKLLPLFLPTHFKKVIHRWCTVMHELMHWRNSHLPTSLYSTHNNSIACNPLIANLPLTTLLSTRNTLNILHYSQHPSTYNSQHLPTLQLQYSQHYPLHTQYSTPAPLHRIHPVRYHCGGWPEEVNTCFLNSYMVYL